MTASLPPDDAVRWREFVAMARVVFDHGDAWATEQADPEGMPVLFQDAEGWATSPLRLACGKGRLALESGDVAGVVLALVEAGRAGRNLEIVERWTRTLEAVDKERQRRAIKTLTVRKADRDRDLLAKLAEAPPLRRKNPHVAAKWLREQGHTNLSPRQIERRLSKVWDALKSRPSFV
jgi:hypothetical protein